jgi:Ca2+-binding RTX toxin-like protein
MSKADLDDAPELLGLNSPYPDSVAWGPSINFTFLTEVPSYYPDGYYFGFVGYDLNGNPRPVRESFLFTELNGTEKQYVTLAASGNNRVLGFNQFTQSRLNDTSQNASATNHITFGKLNYAAQARLAGFNTGDSGAVTLSVGSVPDSIWSNGLLNIPDVQAAGDVWIFNTNYNNHNTYIHELGHALGLHHTHFDLIPAIPRGSYDSGKYTVMSYDPHPGESRAPTEWQILDIAALQHHYGSGDIDKTNLYNEFHEISGNGTSRDRIFSIWDPSGTDKIDAAAYVGKSAYIDLRPGHFSSIGPNAFDAVGSGPADKINDNYTVTLGTDNILGRENISIAFGAYIENATGADGNDVIVGNLLSNILSGNNGSDLLFADGFAIDYANDVLVNVLDRASTNLKSELHSSSSDADYRRVTQGGLAGPDAITLAFTQDRAKQINKLYGDAGNDLLVGSWGKDELFGGADNDILLGDKGDDILDGGAGNDTLDGGDGEDDKVDYSSVAARGILIDVVSQQIGLGQTEAIIQVANDGTNGRDTLVGGIETLVGTSKSDRVVVRYLGNRLNPLPEVASQTLLTLGGASDGDGNILNLAAVTDDVRVDLRSSIQTVNYKLGNLSQPELRLRGVSVLVTGNGDDVVIVGNNLNDKTNVIATGDGDDEIYGGNEKDILRGREGKDTIFGGGGNDELDGGNDADRDTLDGGSGKDIYRVQNNDLITQIDFLDTVFLNGIKLGRATRVDEDDNPETPPRFWQFNQNSTWAGGGVTYNYTAGGTLAARIGGATVTIKNFKNGAGGIQLVPRPTATPVPPVGPRNRWMLSDPLVLDLDGDGIELTAPQTSAVYFDLNVDGVLERTAWVAPDDAILVRDADDTGQIRNGSQFFGSATIDGFSALRVHDSNDDGWIDASDTIWTELRLWQDENSNGVSDAGELKTLPPKGVSRIRLQADLVDRTVNGSRVAYSGRYQFENGTVREAAAVFLQSDTSDTLDPAEVELPEHILNLPELARQGTLRSLSQQMARDPQLVAAVTALVTDAETLGSVQIRDRVKTILHAWAETQNIAPGSRGALVNAQEVAFVEAVEGRPIVARLRDGTLTNQIGTAVIASDISSRFDGWVNYFMTALGFQLPISQARVLDADSINETGPFGPLFQMTYDAATGTIEADVQTVANQIARGLPLTLEAQIAYLDRVMPFLRGLAGSNNSSQTSGVANGTLYALPEDMLADISAGFAAAGITDFALIAIAQERLTANERNLYLGTVASEIISAQDGKAFTVFAGQGDDVITGSAAADTYVYVRGDGADQIVGDGRFVPAGGRANDTLILSGFSAQDVEVTITGEDDADILLTFTGPEGGRILLKDQNRIAREDDFEVGSPLLSRPVETIIFSDGTRWTAGQLLDRARGSFMTESADQFFGNYSDETIAGRGGDDVIAGGLGDDMIEGGRGEDIIFGEGGSDLYIYSAGDGHDTIDVSSAYDYDRENETSAYDNQFERLALHGILRDDVSFRRDSEDPGIIIIDIAGPTPGSITVRGQEFEGGIDRILFDDGTLLGHEEHIASLAIAGTKTAGNDTIFGFNGRDVLEGGKGNDRLIGAGGYDEYVYRLGDGNDVIIDDSGSNKLRLEGVAFADVRFERTGAGENDLRIRILSPVGGSILLESMLEARNRSGVEVIEFDDGRLVYWDELASLLQNFKATEGADTIIGYGGDDIIDGKGGNDTINGKQGRNILIGGAGNDTIRSQGEDIIRGGTGDDQLRIDYFGSVVEYSAGDGNDTVEFSQFANNGKTNVLRLFGINQSDIAFRRGTRAAEWDGREDLIVDILGPNTGSIRLINNWGTTSSDGVDGRLTQIVLDDSVIMSEQIRNLLIGQASTSGDDIIYGIGYRDETISGGRGNDILNGKLGSDRYLYSAGDGDDIIEDTGAKNNILEIIGVNSTNISLSRQGVNALVSINGSQPGSILIKNQFSSDIFSSQGISQLIFDGTTLSALDIAYKTTLYSLTPTITAPVGGGTALGTNQSDTFIGSSANDLLEGKLGGDIYLIGPNGGSDQIIDTGGIMTAEVDILKIATTSDNIKLTRLRNDLLIQFISTGEEVTVKNNFLGNRTNEAGVNGIERIEFSDGQIWSANQILANAWIRGTNGDDSLFGSADDDTFEPLAGTNDIITILDGDGNDRFLYSASVGVLNLNLQRIGPRNQQTDQDTLVLSNLNPDDIKISVLRRYTVSDGYPFAASTADLIVRRSDGTTAVIVQNAFEVFSGSINMSNVVLDRIEFADASQWTISQMLENSNISGTDVADIIFAINGVGGSVIGRGGNDKIYDINRSDTILWQRGDGSDDIFGRAGQIRLQGVQRTDVVFERDQDKLSIRIGADTLTVYGHFYEFGLGTKEIVLDDQIVTERELFEEFVLKATQGDDVITGSSIDDIISGLGGNDIIRGLDGEDQLAGNDGDDKLEGDGGNDTLNGGVGDDIIYGGDNDDILTGGQGADILDGSVGSDRYYWSKGDGNDILVDSGDQSTGTDILYLVDVASTDAILSKQGVDLQIRVTSTNELIIVKEQFLSTESQLGGDQEYGSITGLEEIHFSDGVVENPRHLASDVLVANQDAGFQVAEDNSLQIVASTLLKNDFLPGAGRGAVSAVTSISGGSVSLANDGTMTFVADPDFTGDAWFKYTLLDGSVSTQGTVRVKVVTVNDAPIVEGYTGSTESIAPLSGQIIATDVDGDTLNYSVGAAAAHGTYAVNAADGTFVYTAFAGFSGVDTFAIAVSDGAGATVTANVTVTVLPSTTTPAVPIDSNASANQVTEGASTGAPVGLTVMSTGSTLTYRLTDTAGGRFVIDPTTGIVTIGNAALIDFESSAAHGITVVANNGQVDSAPQTFTVAVINAPPTVAVDTDGNAANNDIAENAAGATPVANLQVLSSDPGGGAVTYAFTDSSGKFVFDAATRQVLLKAGATLDYESDPRSFVVSVVVSDASGAKSAAANFTINITNVIENQSYTGTANADSWTAVSDDTWTVAALAGDDQITTLGGNDTITGGSGNDVLNGGAGDDVFNYSGTAAANGSDAVDGGIGTDTIRALANNTVIGLSGLASVETITAGTFTGVTIVGSAIADTLDFSGVTLTGIVRVDGGDGEDILIGSALGDTLRGSAGHDTLNGNAGDDVFEYTGTAGVPNGYDTIDGGAGNDTLRAIANNAVIGVRTLTGVEAIDGGAASGVTLAGAENADVFDSRLISIIGIAKYSGGGGDDIIHATSRAETLIGGAGNDRLSGADGNDVFEFSGTGDGFDEIDGGAGADVIKAMVDNTIIGLKSVTGIETIMANGKTNVVIQGSNDDNLFDFSAVTLLGITRIDGGGGNDTIIGKGQGDALFGGSGNDRMAGNFGNDTIDGGTGLDVAVYAGERSTYAISTSTGSIKITSIRDNQAIIDGNDGTDTLVNIETAEFKDGVTQNLVTPILLDLDRNGVKLVDVKKSKAFFDFDGDGVRDKTGWVGKGDGILVYDRNGDGLVSNASELSFTDDMAGARSDLEGLRAFDSNADGLFDTNDAKWSSFFVWRDQNSDGQFKTKEKLTLAQAGVKSINLTGRATEQTWDWGKNIVINTGSFTRTDGTTAQFLDAALVYNGTSKRQSGTSSESIALHKSIISLAGWNDFAGRYVQENIWQENIALQAAQSNVSPAALSASIANADTQFAQLIQAMASLPGDGGLSNHRLTSSTASNTLLQLAAAQ